MAVRRAKGNEVGVGYVSVVPEAKDFARQLSSQIDAKALGHGIGKDLDSGIKSGLGPDPIGGPLQKSAKSGRSALDSVLGGMTKLAVGAGAAGAAVFVAGKSAFNAWSDQNEALSKAQVVFGDAFGRIDEMSKNAAKSMGLSRTEAIESAATFGNLFRAMGIGQSPAADMSVALNQLAGDLASFNNANPTDVLEALRSGLVGEAEPLRRFGVNINEARVEAEALRLGLVHNQVVSAEVTAATLRLDKAQQAVVDSTKKYGAGSRETAAATAQAQLAQAALNKAMAGHKVDLDAAQKAQATYSLILKDTSLAQGDYARTADGAANKQRTLTKEWDDFTARAGAVIAPVGMTILDKLQGGLDWLSGWWDEHGEAVMGGLQSVKDWFTETFGPDPVANFQAGAKIVSDAMYGIFGPDPVANFHAGADEIGGLFDELYADFERGSDVVTTNDWWNTFNDELHGVGDYLVWFADKVGKVGEPLGAVVEYIEWLGDKFGKLGEPLGWVVDKIKELPGWLVNLYHDTSPGATIERHDTGGVVGGGVGDPQLILAHGGETVLPTHRPAMAALRGITGAQLMAAQPPPGPLVGNLTVTGQADPAGSAWAIHRELRRVAYYGGLAYT